jgi:hypothetical protein
MSEVMDVMNALGTPLKLAWVGWVAWGVGQYFWFRHERSMPVKRVTSVAKPVVKKPAVAKTVAEQAADAPVVGRLITPTHVPAEAKPSVAVVPQVQPEPAPVAPPMPMPVAAADQAPVPAFDPSKAVAAFDPSKAVAAFDPSNAVIEQFGATGDNVLDKFVRDFEMQDARPRRRQTTRVPETPSYGAEAPQIP